MADDPLYLPEIAKIRQIAGSRGLTYVGDCKMAALGTCVEIVAYGDDSLGPLSAKQMPEAARARPHLEWCPGAQRAPLAHRRRCVGGDGRSSGDRLCLHGRTQRGGSCRAAPHLAGAPSGGALAGLGGALGAELAATCRTRRCFCIMTVGSLGGSAS